MKDLPFVTSLDKNGNTVFPLITENIITLLKHHDDFRDRIRFDEFSNTVVVMNGEGKPEVMSNHHVVRMAGEISRKFSIFQQVKVQMVHDAVSVVSQENKFNTAQNWLYGLKEWDGTPRISKFISEVFRVDPETPENYTEAVSANFLKSIVARVMYPGCKVDTVFVLESKQGAKKSTAFNTLVGDGWYLETSIEAGTKDFYIQTHGKMLIDFSEGGTLSRTEVKRMKNIISTKIDRYRGLFEKQATDHARQFVFVMTTNEEQYLQDETGARRWYPVKVLNDKEDQANIGWIEENREQLFAEALHRVRDKRESWWEYPVVESERQQEERREKNPMREPVADWYYNALSANRRNDGISCMDVWREVYCGVPIGSSLPVREMKKWDEMAISNILKNDLMLEKRRTRRNGIQLNRFYLYPLSEQYKADQPRLSVEIGKGEKVLTHEQAKAELEETFNNFGSPLREKPEDDF